MVKNTKYSIDYANGRPNCPGVEGRIGDFLSHKAYTMAIDFGFELYESDIKWIENNITKTSQNNNRDIFWRFDSASLGKNISKYRIDYIATFFEQFIDLPGIPRNAKRLLIYTVGNLRAWYNIKTEPEPYQHFFIERWLETCR